jgi:D,D-heptose 1,7-bisphosphate phosphatase
VTFENWILKALDKVIFLDRDGTLNPDPGYISSIKQFKFYPDTLTSLSTLAKLGFKFAIVTNQSGIARGLIKEEELEKIHKFISNQFAQSGIPLLGIYKCPHHPKDGCSCRKPKTGLFDEASHQHDIDLSSAVIIGDTSADMKAGKARGMVTCLVRTGKGAEEEISLKDSGLEPDFIGDSLGDCTSFLSDLNAEIGGEDN